MRPKLKKKAAGHRVHGAPIRAGAGDIDEVVAGGVTGDVLAASDVGLRPWELKLVSDLGVVLVVKPDELFALRLEIRNIFDRNYNL